MQRFFRFQWDFNRAGRDGHHGICERAVDLKGVPIDLASVTVAYPCG